MAVKLRQQSAFFFSPFFLRHRFFKTRSFKGGKNVCIFKGSGQHRPFVVAADVNDVVDPRWSLVEAMMLPPWRCSSLG
jgi:hypothetical protein